MVNKDGNHEYGACLTFYEPIDNDIKAKLANSYYVDKISIFTPKALCIISNYSFISQFKEILKQIYSLHLSKGSIPIERYVCNIVDEIPIPTKGKELVQYEIGNALISFNRPLDQIPPYASVFF